MAARSTELFCISRTNKYSLLMEQPARLNDYEHVIDIRRGIEVASSSSVHDRVSNELGPSGTEDRPSSSDRASISQLPLPLSNVTNSSNSSGRRTNTHTRRRRSPLNSRLWIFIELALTLGQIVASVIVLALSGHEHPRTPLFAWIVGYATGCVVTLPLLYWRYLHSNQSEEQDSVQSRQSSSNGNLTAGHSFSRTAQTQEEDNRIPGSSNRSAGGLSALIHNARLKASAEYFKMGLDCFFAIWFVVGNVWIFGSRASSSDAPNLYRLCVVFLILSCIGYAMPFILCLTICCCLPCIISVLGVREDLNETRGATTESLNSLPIYKFKLKKSRNSEGAGEAGVVAAGTANERVISGEDAVCCICLANYANNDELRELPCSHLLHKDCVDKWLKINALCPLCKTEVGETLLSSLAEATTSLRRAESRVGSS